MKTNREDYAIISGEGEQGTIETALLTRAQLTRRLKAERCNGDRWAWAIEMLPGEPVDDAINRGRTVGPRIEA